MRPGSRSDRTGPGCWVLGLEPRSGGILEQRREHARWRVATIEISRGRKGGTQVHPA
jgi:hypothetical protein